MKSDFEQRTEQEKIRFLLSLCWEFTLVARELGQSNVNQKTLERFQGISEITHQIIQSVLSRIEGNNDRYPDDILLKTIYEKSEYYNILSSLEIVWKKIVNKY